MTEIFIPKMGANIDKVTIGEIRVKKGDVVKKGDILFEIVTDKATFEIEADDSGAIGQLNIKEGDELDVLTVVGQIGEGKPEIASSPIKATPKARKLAKENNIDIEKVFAHAHQIIRE